MNAHRSALLLVIGTSAVPFLGAAARAQSSPEFHWVAGGVFHRVAFDDSLNGWASADGGRLMYSQDGGFTWEPADMPDDVRGHMRGVFVRPNPQAPGFDVWAVGDDGAIVRSTDPDAKIFVQVNSSPVLDADGNPAVLYDIEMQDGTDTGYVIGERGVLYRSDDAFQSWGPSSCGLPPSLDPAFNPEPADAYTIHHFPGTDTWIVAADQGWVFRTTDGCLWTEIDITAAGPIDHPNLCPDSTVEGGNLELWSLDVDPADPDRVVLCGGVSTARGYLLLSSDRGASWEQVRCFWSDDLDQQDDFDEVCGIATAYAVAVVGGVPVIACYASQVYTHEPAPAGGAFFDPCSCSFVNDCVSGLPLVQRNVIDPAGNPPLLGLTRITGSSAMCVGTFGILRHMGDVSDASTWTEVGTRERLRVFDGVFVDATTGVVFGQGYRMLRTTNEGQDWTDVTPAGVVDNAQFGRAIAIDPTTGTGVAAGTAGYAAYSDDFGQSWTTTTSLPNTASILAATIAPASGPLPETAYVVGLQGFVAKSTNGGVDYTPLTSPDNSIDLHGVAFADPDVGYVVGARPGSPRTAAARGRRSASSGASTDGTSSTSRRGETGPRRSPWEREARST